MPGLAFFHVTSSRVARAMACCVIVAILGLSRVCVDPLDAGR